MKRYDAVIAGAGPSGLLLGECLTDAGFDVLVIDSGPGADEVAPGSGAADDDCWQYRSATGRLMPLRGAPLHGAPLRGTWGVGGRTVGWGGFCHRFPPSVFARGGWPAWPAPLPDEYVAAERWLHVTSGSLFPEHAKAARQLGWAFVPLRGARSGGRIWTARDARGAPAAVPRTIATRIDRDDRKVRALHVLRPDGSERWVEARAFALAAGPIETARVLLASGVGLDAPRIGKALVEHLTRSWVLVEPVPPVRRRSPTLLDGALVPSFVNLGAATRRPYRGGFSIEITGPRRLSEMPALATALNATAQDVSRFRVTCINAIGETMPHDERWMTLSDTHRDALGRPVPVLHLARSTEERSMAVDMDSACQRIAGALCAPGSELYPLQIGDDEDAPLFHEAGTCSMSGADPPTDPTGRLAVAENLWIADASVFPTAGDRHPTLTLMVHARRVAHAVGRYLRQ